MKYIIINPDTGEHIAAISKDALQLASVLMNEHLFDMLRDHSEQRLIDHVSHKNKELQSVIAAMSRDELQTLSLQQLNAECVAQEPEHIYKLELVPNDTFEPNERTIICRYDVNLLLKAISYYRQRLFTSSLKHSPEDRSWYDNNCKVLDTYSVILAHYYELMAHQEQ